MLKRTLVLSIATTLVGMLSLIGIVPSASANDAVGKYIVSDLPNKILTLSCLSSSTCVGVGGDAHGRPVAASLIGTAWTSEPVAGPYEYGDPLIGISCPSTSTCLAIGSDGLGQVVGQYLMERTPSGWSMLKTPTKLGGVNEISCGGPSDCWAVGRLTGDFENGAFAEQWNGSAWHSAAVPHSKVTHEQQGGETLTVGYELDSVSCPSADMCIAVGREHDGGGPSGQSVDRWNGNTWTGQELKPPTVHDGTDGIWGVSCASATFCMAVGGGDSGPIAYRWSDSKWSRVSTTSLPKTKAGVFSGAAGLEDIACVSATYCLATGYHDSNTNRQTQSAIWNGQAWKTTVAGTDASVTVACDPGGHCVTPLRKGA